MNELLETKVFVGFYDKILTVEHSSMTLPKDKHICPKEMNSIENAIRDSGIKAVHPDKMEDYAAHLVEKNSSKLKNNRPDQKLSHQPFTNL